MPYPRILKALEDLRKADVPSQLVVRPNHDGQAIWYAYIEQAGAADPHIESCAFTPELALSELEAALERESVVIY